MFTVDGIEWNIPCTIDRTAEVSASEISGMLLDKTYFNDIIGTFMMYDISIAVPVGMEGDYAALYEILTNPSESHSFVLPYNQTTIQITARVQTVSDRYYKKEGTRTVWRGTKFSVIANHPSKTMSLSGAIAVGMSPMPAVNSANVGETYELTDSGWELVDYEDGDNNGY